MKPAGLPSWRLPENAERRGQRVQTLFGTDAGKITDRVGSSVSRRARAAVAGQVQAGIHYVDPFARNPKVVGHEVGVVNTRGDEAIDLRAVLPDQIEALAPVRLRQRLQVNIIPLQRTQDRHVKPAFELVHQSRQQAVCQIDDLRPHFGGQPVN